MRAMISVPAMAICAVLAASVPSRASSWQPYFGADYTYLQTTHTSPWSKLTLPVNLTAGASAHIGNRFSRHFAVEIGYQSNDGTRNFSITTGMGPKTTVTQYLTKNTVSAPYLDTFFFVPLWQTHISVLGTAGVSYVNSKWNITGGPKTISKSKSTLGYRAGAGFEWRPLQRFGIRAVARYQSAGYPGTSRILIGSVGMNIYF